MILIKFRARLTRDWNTHKAGEWITFTPQDLDNNLSRLWIDWDTLGRYTGVSDKNHREIWEGDILKLEVHDTYKSALEDVAHRVDEISYGAIVFSRGAFRLFGHEMSARASDCEICGNIFENPELLK